MGKYIGESVLRKEDPRLVTGEAKYLEDIQLSGMVQAVVKRSDYAHAKIKNIDTSEAEKVPGVIGVWTGKDFEDVNPMPCAWQAGGVDNNANTPRVLEIDKVTFTGQGVAVVVAEDRNIAEDASSKIVVDFEELPTVVSAEEAIKPGAPQLHENAQNNICMEWQIGDLEATEKTLQEVPVAVSVVTADTIEKANIIDILDLKAVVPSLDTRQRTTSTQSTFFIRGFGNGDYNQGIEPSVAVFIDGIYRSKMQSQISDLPIVERIEVLRGPQSTLFGKNATAGVINVVTKKPSFEKSGFISTTFGNYNSCLLYTSPSPRDS